jgi:hypothetical protein
VCYPILPKITRLESEAARRDILEIRHSSLYAPRDFDISPYFQLVKADHRARLRLPPHGLGAPAAHTHEIRRRQRREAASRAVGRARARSPRTCSIR